MHLTFTDIKQECIPVGFVPQAAEAVCWGGGCSASVHAGIHPMGVGLETPLGVGLETPQVWAWRPPSQTPQPPAWVWAWSPPKSQTPQLPPWVWTWRPPQPEPQPPPWVWTWRPARHAGIPTSPCGQNDRHM